MVLGFRGSSFWILRLRIQDLAFMVESLMWNTVHKGKTGVTTNSCPNPKPTRERGPGATVHRTRADRRYCRPKS